MALQHLRSNTASKRPTAGAMSDGQIAVNTNATSPGLFFKDAGGAIIKVGPVHVGTTAPNSSPAGSTGNSIGEQWLDTSGGGYVLKIWDGSAWRSEVGEFVDAAGDTMTGALILPNGTAAAPALGVGSTDNGLYSPGADQLALSTNGTGRLFVDGSGNVYLKSTVNITPTNVSNYIAISNVFSDTNIPGIGFDLRRTANGEHGHLFWSGRSSGGNARLLGSLRLEQTDTTAANAGGALIFSTNPGTTSQPTERLRITSDGKVGVGTSSPDTTLTVRGPTNGSVVTLLGSSGDTSRKLVISNSDNDNDWDIDANRGTFGALSLSTGGTKRLFIDEQGRVGVGTTSPQNALVVKEAADANDSAYVEIVSGNAANSGILFSDTDAATRAGVLYNHSDEALRFMRAGFNEAARIDSSGRLGIGTSSPAKKLHIEDTSGPAQIRITGPTGSSDIYADSNIYFQPNGSTAVTFTSTGRVGIGTTSPGATLHIHGGGGKIRFGTNLSFYSEISHDTSVNANIVYNNRDNAGHQFMQNDTTELARIDSSGRLGIGTSSPGELLHVNGNISLRTDAYVSDGFIVFGDSGTPYSRVGRSGSSNDLFVGTIAGSSNLTLQSTGTGAITCNSGGTERARIDSSGRLLVGTSSDSQVSTVVLQGSTSGAANNSVLRLCRGESSPADGAALGFIAFGDSGHTTAASIQTARDGGTWTSGTSQPTRLVFSTTADGASSPTERMRIKSDSTIIFGDGAGGFDGVNGGSSFTLGTSARMLLNLSSASTGSMVLQKFYNPNGEVGNIITSGSSTSFNTSSDYRLKENVTPVTDGIIRLQQLKPSRFNFIADPDTVIDGFLAHEVQAIVPEAITGEKDAVDDDGNPEYQGIDQSKLVPLLTAALQEAIGRIETLEAEVAALKAQ